MSYDEFINMSKKMVIEYYNRYVCKKKYLEIDYDNVILLDYKYGDDTKKATLFVNSDSIENKYIVEYNDKTKELTSNIIYES